MFVGILCSLVSMAQSIKTVEGTTTTWDFTKVTATMCAGLSEGNWTEDTSKKMFSSSASAGDESPEFLGGLTINTCGSDKSRIYYDGKTGYCFNGGSAYIIIPVQAGQTLKVYSGQQIKSSDVTFTAMTGGYKAEVPEGKTSVKIVRNSGATYVTKIELSVETGQSSQLAVTTPSTASTILQKGETLQMAWTTPSSGAISFSSSATGVATVSDAGLITAVGNGKTTITVAQAADATYKAGSINIDVLVPYAADLSAESATLNHTNYAFSNSDNTVYYFNNGFTMSNNGKKGEGYATLEGNTGMKFSANTEYTINIPEGITVYSATVIARSNYDNTANAAQLGSIFGQTITENLPFSNEVAIEKEFEFAGGVTGSELKFTPTGNQIQMIIILSTVEPSLKPTKLFFMKTAATGNVSIDAAAKHVALPAAANLTVRGGSVTVTNEQSSAKNLVTSAGFAMTNGNTYFTVTLDEPLKAGDVITATMSAADRGLKFSTDDAYSSNYPGAASSTTAFTYTVTTGDGICGESIFNIFRATGNSTYFNNFEITRPAAAVVNINPEIGYATFYDSEHAVVVPEGVVAGIVGAAPGMVMPVPCYFEGAVIPAGEAVILKGSGDVKLAYTISEEEPMSAYGQNFLAGFDTDNTTVCPSFWEEEYGITGNCYYYALTLNADGDTDSADFYWMNETGAAFTSAGHKAYLAIPVDAFDMLGIGGGAEGYAKANVLNRDATAIKNVNTSANSAKAQMFNIAGQRVNGSAKGIIIKNGKKMLVK